MSFDTSSLLAGFMAVIVVLSPAGAAPPPLPGNSAPAIPAGTFKITDYGAIGDGKTMATQAFSDAIAACARAGGGTVLVPAGTYLATPFRLGSHQTLFLEKGAVIQASDKATDFGLPGVLPTTQAQLDALRPLVRPLIEGDNLTDVAISGEGRIDGAGAIWWKGSTERSTRVTKLPYPPRPFLVAFNDCRRVRLSGITLSNSPKIHIIIRSCDDVTMDGLTITAPPDAPNTAAIIATSTRHLVIRHCLIDVDDDHVALNASHAWSTEDVTIADCRFGRGHGVSIGSDITSGVRNVVVRNCTFENSGIGLRIKSPPNGGGLVENITYQDISMHNVGLALTINLHYADRPIPNPSPSSPAAAAPVVRHVEFTRITVEGAKRAGEFIGLPASPLREITLQDVRIAAQAEFKIQDADVTQTRVTVQPGASSLPHEENLPSQPR